MLKRIALVLACILILFGCAKSEPIYSNADTASVYTTPSGKKYHRESCKTITDSKLTARSIDEAIKKGYESCKVCKP